jgi:NADH:ubiquinone oxidoreductase subunit H
MLGYELVNSTVIATVAFMAGSFNISVIINAQNEV